VLVEASPVLRDVQRELLELEPPDEALGPFARPAGDDAPSHVAGSGPVFTALDDLPALEVTGLVLANELLDNLPFRLARGGSEGTVEVLIDADGDRLVEVERVWEDGPELGSGDETAVPVAALPLLDDLAVKLHRGYILLIDYGVADGPTGGVRGYREHTEHDVLRDPGGSDVTAGVDLSRITERAAQRGMTAMTPVRQAAALGALGYDRWAAAMRERQAALRRGGRDADAVRVWQTRSRASLLVDPAQLGSLWWLVLATPGLPRPGWLQQALADQGSAGRRPIRDVDTLAVRLVEDEEG
jgi:SAM-dependent MidA family methyltransferase